MKFGKNVKSWVASILFLPIIVFFTLNKGRFTFIDYFNTLVHEGGHGLFSFFGKFLHVLGRTLMQIILPSIFIFYFWSNKKRISVQLSIILLGENFMNIGVYATDARAQQLPLLGGSKVYHDWAYILRELGLLNFDLEIGFVFYLFGLAAFVVSFFMPLLMKNYEEVSLDLEIK
ncbi:MAG: hypothetical protein A2V66_09510 [Ignavibacteria bacterium RBG_13_36_8]|nr:MAG: hypothetical protein A2V66_09510 [Ignavibacteria bacterium RBG_13_36_8]